MTLSSITTKVTYNGDGATTDFAIGFVFWDSDDLRVIHRDAGGTETVWTRGTQYTLTGGAGATGTLTVRTLPTDYTPAAGETLTIKDNQSETQGDSLPLSGAFPSTVVEQRLDKLTRLIQIHSEEIARTILLPETASLSGLTIPEPGAGELLRYNAGGTALETVMPGDVNAAFSAVLSGLANNDFLIYETAGGVWKNLASGATGRALLGDAGAADARTTLGLGTAALVNTGAAAGNVPTNDQAFVDVASAATTDIGAATSLNVRITGTTTITGLGTVAAGMRRKARFAASLTLTHNATSLILPGSANIATAADDTAEFISLGSGNWLCLGYKRAVGPGNVLQIVQTQDSAVATGTTVMPLDDTIPQNTEGNEFMTLAIAPKSADSRLKIEVVCNVAHSVAGLTGAALFVDSTADALAAVDQETGGANRTANHKFTFDVASGSTAARTYKVRAGSGAAGTTTFNGTAGGRRLGGVYASSIIITEYLP